MRPNIEIRNATLRVAMLEAEVRFLASVIEALCADPNLSQSTAKKIKKLSDEAILTSSRIIAKTMHEITNDGGENV